MPLFDLISPVQHLNQGRLLNLYYNSSWSRPLHILKLISTITKFSKLIGSLRSPHMKSLLLGYPVLNNTVQSVRVKFIWKNQVTTHVPARFLHDVGIKILQDGQIIWLIKL